MTVDRFQKKQDGEYMRQRVLFLEAYFVPGGRFASPESQGGGGW